MTGSIEQLTVAVERLTEAVEKLLEEQPSPATPSGGKRNTKTAEDDDKGTKAKGKTAGKKRATKQDLSDALKEYVEAEGKPAAKKLLAEFGVKSPTELNSAQYGKVIEAINAALEGGAEEEEEEETDDDFDF